MVAKSFALFALSSVLGFAFTATGCVATTSGSQAWLSFGSTSGEFGFTSVGTPVVQTFTLSNTFSSDAQLGDMSPAGLGVSSPYIVTGQTCATGMTLQANEGNNCTITITFNPTTPAYWQNVTITATLTGLNSASTGDASATALQSTTSTATLVLSGNAYLTADATTAGSLSYYQNGTGPLSLSYWQHGSDVGSLSYWKNGTGPGSLSYWQSGSGPGSLSYWQNGSGPCSLSYWQNGTGPGSLSYWQNGNGPLSLSYYQHGTASEWSPEDGVPIMMLLLDSVTNDPTNDGSGLFGIF